MTPDRPSYKWWVALTVLPAGLISAVDATGVGIAIPSMMTSLRADLDQIQWVVTISLVMQTLLMPTAGWLTGLVGRRNLFVGSLVLVSLGTVLCSLAWSLESLICFRALQGVGAGTLQPVSLAILYGAFPPQQRGTAMGLFNMSVALGLIIGRFGGFLVDAFNWRVIFYLILPFSLSSAVLGFLSIPSSERQRQWHIDTWGLLSMGGFLIPLLLALTRGRFEGWDSPSIRALFLVSGVSFVVFITAELRSASPVVELRLYRNVNFALGSLVQFLVAILFMSSTFLINIFLQRVYQFTPSQVGVLMFPQGIVYGLGSLWAGRLSDYFNPRLPLMFGLICFALVYYWLGSISVFATATVIMGMLCLRSFSFSCVNSPNTLLTLRALPDDKVGMATGLFSVARGIAGTLGVALSATFLEHRRTLHALQYSQQQGLLDLPSQWALSGLQQTFEGVGNFAGLARVKAEVYLHSMMLGEATTAAYQDIFLLSAGISLFNILPALLRRRAPSRRQTATDDKPDLPKPRAVRASRRIQGAVGDSADRTG
jgi:DHA2 family multidrug resistance protein